MKAALDHRLRQAILRVLSRRAGPGADAAAIAAGAVQLHDDLAAYLTPLIGPAGVTAVSARSIHLAQRELPWLTRTRGSERSDDPLKQLRTSLEQQPAAVATEGAVAVLASFGLLLTTFLGAGLTMRLLRGAWPDVVSEDIGEETST